MTIGPVTGHAGAVTIRRTPASLIRRSGVDAARGMPSR
jgi:hypothetical protein